MTAPPPNLIHVLQGEYRLSNRPGDMLSTLLGSCVAACVYDPVTGVGGMNHFLLPDGGLGDKASLRYGVNSMEQMINALLKSGADRRRMEAKIFGGGRMLPGLRNIGQDNIEFARWFLNGESIRITSENVGGTQGRKLRFWPVTGQAQVQLMQPHEAPPPQRPRLAADDGAVELF
ncbi:chemotaxis protein CheD [Halodurantibacterium flavum]|uniref:Probable chemoreceptor glutamine deamidase CheD n=1 Tax=Halodurantibacterium flavum TaxID=1382802 RepID=A0ABW4S9X3_9RHOB